MRTQRPPPEAVRGQRTEDREQRAEDRDLRYVIAAQAAMDRGGLNDNGYRVAGDALLVYVL